MHACGYYLFVPGVFRPLINNTSQGQLLEDFSSLFVFVRIRENCQFGYFGISNERIVSN